MKFFSRAYIALSLLLGLLTQGAARADDTWWSRQAMVKPVVPPANEWCRNEIDRFILEKLRGKAMKPSAQADSLALVRRVTHDLTGLPPTPREVEEFLQSSGQNADKAYEALVNRLLESPRYGERFARHWLDVA